MNRVARTPESTEGTDNDSAWKINALNTLNAMRKIVFLGEKSEKSNNWKKRATNLENRIKHTNSYKWRGGTVSQDLANIFKADNSMEKD